MPFPSPEAARCPYPVHAALRADGGVHAIPGREGEYVVTTYSEIAYATQHPEVFSNATPLNAEAQTGWEKVFFSCDPPEHTTKRKIAFRSFTPRKLRGYQEMIQAQVDAAIDAFIADRAVEFVSGFADPISVGVMFEIMDLPHEAAGWIASASFDGVGARYMPAEKQAAQERDGVRLNEFMSAVVAERIAERGDDAISELISAWEEQGELDRDYLAAEAGIILLGGILTPSNMIASAMQLLLEHPEQAAKVRADRALIPRMLEEALRIESPDQFMPRYTTCDTELGGVEIPAGSLVLLVYAAGNRDDAEFADPDQFDVERPNVKRHLAFGMGPHFCMGAPLARLEGRLAFETLFDRLGDIRLAEGHTDVKPLESVLFRAPQELHIEFEVK